MHFRGRFESNFLRLICFIVVINKLIGHGVGVHNCIRVSLELVFDCTKEVSHNEGNETFRVVHEQLVTGIRQHVKLRFSRGEELICLHDFSGTTRVHPVLVPVDKRNRERDIGVSKLVCVVERLVRMKAWVMLHEESVLS